LPASW